MSFLSDPKDAGRLFTEVRQKNEDLKKAIRFFDLPIVGGAADVLFLDGVIGEDKFLMCPTVHLHKNFEDKRPVYYACTNFRHGECPLCEEDVPVSFYGLFTVFLLTGVKAKNGEMYGANTRQVFAAKQSVLQTLNKMAEPRGGIKGWKCRISRKEERSARTGDLFDFVKDTGLEGFEKIEKSLPGSSKPVDYNQVILQLTPDQLRERGFGVKHSAAASADHDYEGLKNDLKKMDTDSSQLDLDL